METTKQQPIDNPPENYLVWAILSTICCCLPLGIVNIIKSTKLKELWAQGDAMGAEKASADTKKWLIWTAVAGVIVGILYAILAFVIGIGGAFASAGSY